MEGESSWFVEDDNRNDIITNLSSGLDQNTYKFPGMINNVFDIIPKFKKGAFYSENEIKICDLSPVENIETKIEHTISISNVAALRFLKQGDGFFLVILNTEKLLIYDLVRNDYENLINNDGKKFDDISIIGVNAQCDYFSKILAISNTSDLYCISFNEDNRVVFNLIDQEVGKFCFTSAGEILYSKGSNLYIYNDKSLSLRNFNGEITRLYGLWKHFCLIMCQQQDLTPQMHYINLDSPQETINVYQIPDPRQECVFFVSLTMPIMIMKYGNYLHMISLYPTENPCSFVPDRVFPASDTWTAYLYSYSMKNDDMNSFVITNINEIWEFPIEIVQESGFQREIVESDLRPKRVEFSRYHIEDISNFAHLFNEGYKYSLSSNLSGYVIYTDSKAVSFIIGASGPIDEFQCNNKESIVNANLLDYRNGLFLVLAFSTRIIVKDIIKKRIIVDTPIIGNRGIQSIHSFSSALLFPSFFILIDNVLYEFQNKQQTLRTFGATMSFMLPIQFGSGVFMSNIEPFNTVSCVTDIIDDIFFFLSKNTIYLYSIKSNKSYEYFHLDDCKGISSISSNLIAFSDESIVIFDFDKKQVKRCNMTVTKSQRPVTLSNYGISKLIESNVLSVEIIDDQIMFIDPNCTLDNFDNNDLVICCIEDSRLLLYRKMQEFLDHNIVKPQINENIENQEVMEEEFIQVPNRRENKKIRKSKYENIKK